MTPSERDFWNARSHNCHLTTWDLSRPPLFRQTSCLHNLVSPAHPEVKAPSMLELSFSAGADAREKKNWWAPQTIPCFVMQDLNIKCSNSQLEGVAGHCKTSRFLQTRFPIYSYNPDLKQQSKGQNIRGSKKAVQVKGDFWENPFGGEKLKGKIMIGHGPAKCWESLSTLSFQRR